MTTIKTTKTKTLEALKVIMGTVDTDTEMYNASYQLYDLVKTNDDGIYNAVKSLENALKAELSKSDRKLLTSWIESNILNEHNNDSDFDENTIYLTQYQHYKREQDGELTTDPNIKIRIINPFSVFRSDFKEFDSFMLDKRCYIAL